MVYFDQHIIFPATTQVYIGILILVLFLLVLAVLYVGMMIHQLRIVIRRHIEMSGRSDCAQARKVEGKKE
jgi:hypothetical protein